MTQPKQPPVNPARFSWNEETELTFQQALDQMDRTIKDLLKTVPRPQAQTLGEVVVHRFSEGEARHALIMKLVQLTSNLRAGRLLIDHGFTYEWAMTRRLLYETMEDLMFLLGEGWVDSRNNLHERFLEGFYTEDFDTNSKAQRKRSRFVNRDEIAAFVSKVGEATAPEEAAGETSLKTSIRTMHRFGSGYIHGRAASIMRLYDAETNEFQTNGVNSEEDLGWALKGFWLVVYMSIACFAAVRGRWWRTEYRDDALRFAENFRETAGVAGPRSAEAHRTRRTARTRGSSTSPSGSG